MILGLKRIPKELSIISVLEYLLVLFVVLYSGLLALLTSANSNTFFRLGLPIILILFFLRCRLLKAARWQRVVFLAIYLLLYIVFSLYNPIRYILYFFAPITLMVLYFGVLDEQADCFNLLYKLSDVVVIIAAVSTFLYFFGTLLDVIPGESTVEYYWGDTERTCTTYFHLLYETQPINFLGHTLIRNSGIFPEAPGFAIFLVYSISVETLLRKKVNIIRCVILGIAIITTYSAKAIILAAGALALKYIIYQSPSVSLRRLKLILIPTACILVGGISVVLLWDKMQTVSFFMRLDDVIACIKAWITSPIIGTGYWNDESIIPFFSYPERYNNGLSMGIAVILAQGGIFLTILYIVPLMQCILRFKGQKRLSLACFFIVYLGLLFTSNMPYSFLALFLLAFSLEAGRNNNNNQLNTNWETEISQIE